MKGRSNRLKSRLVRMLAILTAAVLCWVLPDHVLATNGTKVRTTNVRGVVTDSQGRPIAGAKVYLVDVTLIKTTQITPAAVLAGTPESYDEPLEDIIRNAELAPTLPQALTEESGRFILKKVNASLTYFPFVVPADSDTDHLPGGDLSRIAFSPKEVARTGLKIQISWKAATDASYIGSSACLQCHTGHVGWKKSAHSLAIRATGKLGGNQDLSYHPEGNDYTNQFTPAANYTATGVKVLYYQDYNAALSQKFDVIPDTAKAGTVYLKVYLWKQNTAGAADEGTYYLTLENPNVPTDKTRTFKVGWSKGGYMNKQYLLLELPGRKGHYYGFGYQGFTGPSQGKMSWYDRTRHPYNDSLASFVNWGADKAYGTADDKWQLPAVTGTFEGSCGACHFNGYSNYIDATTGEKLANAVPDPAGASDLAGDGVLRDLSIGCERCHGPGSKHRDEALLAPAAATTRPHRGKTVVDNHKGKYIVNPSLLGNDRASLICGRCHRAASILDYNNFPLPGIGRAEFLANHVDPKAKGPPLTDYWPDQLHAKKGKNYPDWLSSKHALNHRRLVSCEDCHDLHLKEEHPRLLRYSPEESDSPLCQRCHSKEIVEHSKDKTGDEMTGSTNECIECHMPKTALEGAGRPGMVLGALTGASTDANLVYWQNDVPSHVFDVPTKFSVGVAGVTPGSAMPIPYTSSCGTCHDVSMLKYQAPK